jgi:hypothetical protein
MTSVKHDSVTFDSDQKLYDADFWRALLRAGSEEDESRPVLWLVNNFARQERWGAFAGAMVAGVPTSSVGGDVLSRVVIALDESLSASMLPVTLAREASWRGVEPLLRQWISAMQGPEGDAEKVKAAGELLRKAGLASLEVARQLTASGMSYEHCLTGDCGRSIYDRLQELGTRGNQNIVEIMGALLPAKVAELPLLRLTTLDSKRAKKPMLLVDALGDTNRGTWFQRRRMAELFIERCPAQAERWAHQIESSLTKSTRHPMPTLEIACLIAAGVPVNDALRDAIEACFFTSGQSEPKSLLRVAMEELRDSDAADLVERWHAAGLDIDSAHAKWPQQTPLHGTVDADLPMTASKLLDLGANPSLRFRAAGDAIGELSSLADWIKVRRSSGPSADEWNDVARKVRAAMARRAAELAVADVSRARPAKGPST